MVKKILSSIILMIIICSTCVYGTDLIVSENISNPSQEQGTINPSDSIPNTSENQNTETSTEVNLTPGGDTNTNQNEANNNQEGSSIKQPTTDVVQKPEKTPTNNNQENVSNVVTVKSSEARLKQLKVDLEGLTPDFDKNITEYYLVVDLSVEQIPVTVKTVDDNAKVTVLGNKNIVEGENTITIKVTAEDGTTKKYYIYVTKIDNIELANAELESLEIGGFNLYPTFKSNIYTYNLNINQDIKTLDIAAIPQREKAVVQIEGNEALQEGENIIKITVTAEDETTIRTYKINTFINSDKVEIEEEDKMPAVILMAVLIIVIVVLGIFIIIKNKR